MSETSTPDVQREKASTPGGPEWWRQTFCYMTGMGMDDAERTQFELNRHRKKAEKDCKRCEKDLAYLKRYSLFTLQFGSWPLALPAFTWSIVGDSFLSCRPNHYIFDAKRSRSEWQHE